MCLPSPLETYSLGFRVIQCSGESPGQRIILFGGRLKEFGEDSTLPLNFLSWVAKNKCSCGVYFFIIISKT